MAVKSTELIVPIDFITVHNDSISIKCMNCDNVIREGNDIVFCAVKTQDCSDYELEILEICCIWCGCNYSKFLQVQSDLDIILGTGSIRRKLEKNNEKYYVSNITVINDV